MLINNILSSYQSENPMRYTGWRSHDLKNKAVELRLTLMNLAYIAELLFISSNTAAQWCRDILGRKKALAISKQVDNIARCKEKEKRKLKIVRALKRNPSLTNVKLSKRLKVSVVTIRKDIREIKELSC